MTSVNMDTEGLENKAVCSGVGVCLAALMMGYIWSIPQASGKNRYFTFEEQDLQAVFTVNYKVCKSQSMIIIYTQLPVGHAGNSK